MSVLVRPLPLPPSTRTLAVGAPTAPVGSILVLGADRGYLAPPGPDPLLFGRCWPEVHVPVGVCDVKVSRRHGTLHHDGTHWLVRNDGRLPIRLPGDTLVLTGHERVLPPGYTPMFVGRNTTQLHLVEVRVIDQTEPSPAPTHPLSAPERLVLTALTQRYLRQELNPHPVPWPQVADELNHLSRSQDWTPTTAARVVGEVCDRITDHTPGTDPITALLATATLAPPDLRLLGTTG